MTGHADHPPHLRVVSEEDGLDNLFLDDADVEAAKVREAERRKQPPRGNPKRRQFRRFDETWAEELLPLLNPIGRLALVLLAEADFRQRIKATSETAKAAKLTLKQQRVMLAQLEGLGLVAVERRGSGRAYIVTPLRLGGRPGRR